MVRLLLAVVSMAWLAEQLRHEQLSSSVRQGWGLGLKEAQLGPVVLAACQGLAEQRESLRYPALRQLRALKML